MKKIQLLFLSLLFGTAAYSQELTNDKGYINNYGNSYYRFISEDGVLFLSVKPEHLNDIGYHKDVLIKYPQSKNLSSYTIPDGIATIAKGAFQGNKYLQKVIIPSSVKYIGDNAFADCDALVSIETYESTSSVRAVENGASTSDVKEVGRYNIQGVKIEEGVDGQVQIILYSDGTARKVIE